MDRREVEDLIIKAEEELKEQFKKADKNQKLRDYMHFVQNLRVLGT